MERWSVPLADEELARRHLAGDRRAFAELVERYSGPVFNLAYRLTHDRPEAENIAQETFLRAYRALPRSDWQRPFRPWLFTIAANLCRDRARQRREWSFTDLVDETGDESVADEWPDEAPLPAERLEEDELRQALQRAVDALPPAYRAAVVLRYTEGLSYEQIAVALNLPLNTVRTHLSRARQRLRTALAAELGEAP
jgi:RNA polymerase sigma-70 factor (ECF subfamily)